MSNRLALSHAGANQRGRVPRDRSTCILPLPQLEEIDDYRRRFPDPAYWQPYVDAVLARHGLGPGRAQVHTPGTYPVFVVRRRWTIKFFGRLFDGEHAFEVERQVHELLSARAKVPAPALVASGCLYAPDADWPWPYLIFRYIPGLELGVERDRLPQDALHAIAAHLGRLVRRIHQLPLPPDSALEPTWTAYRHMLERGGAGDAALCREKHRQWGSLPTHLLDQIGSFLLPMEDLIPSAPPCPLHADLTAEHVILRQRGTAWQIAALIDWGDAVAGDPAYEWIALHLHGFQCDKALLRTFLQAYGHSPQVDAQMAHMLTCLCLLHPFDVFAPLCRDHPEVQSLDTLADLADWLWRIKP